MNRNISVGVLYSCKELLEFIGDISLDVTQWNAHFDKFHVAQAKEVFEVCQACKWLSLSEAGVLAPTRAGQIIAKAETVTALRVMLLDFILEVRPVWSAVIPRGRSEAIPFLPDETRQCFREAELCGPLDAAVISCWDELAAVARGARGQALLEIGRLGEELTLQYERERTGLEPCWMAIESNLAGYDVESVTSDSNRARLLIEVKASERPLSELEFFISANEWRIASESNNYIFHIWADIKKNPKLFILTKERVASHVPANSGAGSWVSASFLLEPILG